MDIKPYDKTIRDLLGSKRQFVIPRFQREYSYIIFTVEQVIQYMNCGRDKAMKTLAELDTKKGIGLIERVKQGFGKPDIIYVKNFILRTSKDVKNNDESEESIQQNREVEEVDLSESEKSTYRGRINRRKGVG